MGTNREKTQKCVIKVGELAPPSVENTKLRKNIYTEAERLLEIKCYFYLFYYYFFYSSHHHCYLGDRKEAELLARISVKPIRREPMASASLEFFLKPARGKKNQKSNKNFSLCRIIREVAVKKKK